MFPTITTERVTFLSTRIAGTDGVSLETKKWADVLSNMGMTCSFIAGKCDQPPECTRIIEHADFNHPDILSISREAFGREHRSEKLTERIVSVTEYLRLEIAAAIADLGTDLLIVENALTLPVNIPLGLAVVQLIQQLDLPCIAHHHDFVWERERFLINGVDDMLAAAFPPHIDRIQHVVINKQAANEFSRRTGLSCRIIPNVMDFNHRPTPPDDFANTFRKELGLADDDIVLLQPTRIVPRKAIERSIELARRLHDASVKLVISHEAGDEGLGYLDYLNEYADLLEVPVLFASDRIGEFRSVDKNGLKHFAIGDAYPQVDLVSYPSAYEGFGNAFLEAIYFRRPIVCNRYTIYRTDLEPTGICPIVFDGFISQSSVDAVRRVLADDAYREEMVDRNYEIARRSFSYQVLEEDLRAMLLRTCS